MKKLKDAVMQFVQGLAEILKAKPEDIIQIAQLLPDALEVAVLKYQETQGDMTLAAQAFKDYLEKKTKVARHGAKLQYIKNLKNQCADDEEVYYYKKGGSLGCGCKKKENGGEVIKASTGVELFREDLKKKKLNLQQKPKWNDTKDNRLKVLSEKRTLTPLEKQELKQLRLEFENSSNRKDYELEEGKKGMKVEKDYGGSAVIAKFKAKCGAKMKKHELGGSLKHIPFYQDGGKNKKSINDYYLTDYSEPNILQKAKLNGKELTIKVNKGLQKGEDPITIQGNNYYLKGDSTLVKDNSIPYSFLQLRNAGINKKYNGGNLNQIPFYLAGGQQIVRYDPMIHGISRTKSKQQLIDEWKARQNTETNGQMLARKAGELVGNITAPVRVPVKAAYNWITSSRGTNNKNQEAINNRNRTSLDLGQRFFGLKNGGNLNK